MPPRDPSRFAAFILTHGRPDKVITHRSLRRHGYTGPIYLIIDDEDPTGDEYRARFGAEWVITFSKAEIARTFDAADLSADRRTIVYARNASFGIARALGLDYFLQLDDDYTTFIHRIREPGPNSRFGVSGGSVPIHDFDAVVLVMLRLLEETGALTVAFSQGGDHIGGLFSQTIKSGWKRKAMNTFFVRTDRPVRFLGRLNEDVNAYTLWGSRGELFLTVSALQIQQVATQHTTGGMTEAYLATGTYAKSFSTVMMCPSFVRIWMMGRTDRRLHHRIDWRHAVPKILSPELRKAS